MHSGQNSIASESSLPQLGQVRWRSVLMVLTALQPKATPRSTESRKNGQNCPFQTVIPFHKQLRVPLYYRAKSRFGTKFLAPVSCGVR
jgi:hypothetical protein